MPGSEATRQALSPPLNGQSEAVIGDQEFRTFGALAFHFAVGSSVEVFEVALVLAVALFDSGS